MTFLLALLVSLGGLSAVILGKYIQCLRQLRRITRRMEELRSGHGSGYFLIRTSNASINELAEELNLLSGHLRNLTNRTERLERAQRQIMTNIAHDLRTPLTSLSGYAELLKTDSHRDKVTTEKYIDIIFTKSQMLEALIRNFFDWAKLEADDVAPNLQKLNITIILQEVVATYYQDFEKIGVSPVLDFPAYSVFAWADPAGMERILGNLITNSIRYGYDGGIHGIKMREEQEKVWIEVWDCGKGIDPEDLSFIFDRLYMGEASRRMTSHGSGLGLSITKKLVEKQGGEILVRSVPYEKTSFSFYLLKTMHSGLDLN